MDFAIGGNDFNLNKYNRGWFLACTERQKTFKKTFEQTPLPSSSLCFLALPPPRFCLFCSFPSPPCRTLPLQGFCWRSYNALKYRSEIVPWLDVLADWNWTSIWDYELILRIGTLIGTFGWDGLRNFFRFGNF